MAPHPSVVVNDVDFSGDGDGESPLGALWRCCGNVRGECEQGASMCVSESVRACVHVYVCYGNQEKCLFVREVQKDERFSVCVSVHERECMCVSACLYLCVCLCFCN